MFLVLNLIYNSYIYICGRIFIGYMYICWIYLYVNNICRYFYQSTSGLLWGFKRRIFNVSVTAPVSTIKVPFVHVWTISYGTLNGVLYLKSFFSYHYLISNSIIVINYWRVLANNVFFNLRLFTMKYKSPIR